MSKRVVAGLIGACAFALAATPASAAQHTVDNDRVQCPSAEYTSIQAAVTAAAPGDTIRVCAGTYTEQVTIPASKDGLRLWATPRQAAVIKAPPVMADPKAIVHVLADDVDLRNFTISGPGGGPCDSLRFGVFVGGGGSALIKNNHITLIRDTPFSGCQNGIGVLAGRSSQGETGDVELVGNLIDEYQKGGVVIDGEGSFGEIDQNRIEGIGPTATIAQNGIQVSRGADGELHKNVILDNTYSLAPVTSSAGIILFETDAGVLVEDNYGARNDDNLAAYTTEGAVIERNEFVRSTFYDGIYMGSDSAGNEIRNNFLRENSEHDCHDDSTGPGTAGTANLWVHNDGVTQNRLGLCAARGGVKPGKTRVPNRRSRPYGG